MSDPVLAVNGLARRFGDVRAVRDVSFAIEAGRVTALLGENGAGKSTTMRIVLGFLRKDAGEVRRGAGAVGYVPEQPAFFPWARGEELLYGAALCRRIPAPVAGERIRRWSERLSFPPSLMERRASTYSHGNRKKLSYLQSLVLEPELFVADEPFTALDPPSIRTAREVFRELAGSGRAVLLSSHLISEIGKIYDDLVVIHRGSTVLRARREDLGPDADLEALFLDAII
jgi:ABC-type multidrug transport system ATPase subunit